MYLQISLHVKEVLSIFIEHISIQRKLDKTPSTNKKLIFFINIFKQKNKKKSPPRVQILFFPQNFYYFYLGAHAKSWNPTATPSGDLNNSTPQQQQED